MEYDDDFSNEETLDDEVVDKTSSSNTSQEKIKSIVSAIMVNSRNVDGVMVPVHGAISAAAKKFEVSKSTASRIFSRAKKKL
jgi:hypothetical protein